MQYDYRQVYSSVIKNWFGATDAAINQVQFEDYVNNRIDYIECKELSTAEIFKENLWMNCYPNPSSSYTTVEYYLHQSGHVEIEVFDMSGRSLEKVVDENANQGKHSAEVDLSQYQSGTYLFKLTTNNVSINKKVIYQR